MTTTKKKVAATAAFLSATLLAGAPLRGGMVGMGAPDPGLSRVADAYAAAMRAGDAAAAAALYGDEAVEMPPGKPPIRGRAAIEAYYRGLFETCRFTEFELNHWELRADGDVGYAAGNSRQTLQPGTGAPTSDSGKYLVVLKRTGGAWKVAYAIYNSDRVGQAPSGSAR